MISAKERALKLLAIGDKTEKEVTDKLRSYNHTEDEILETLDYLKDLGYIDDRKYTKNHIERSINKKRGRIRIRSELRKKGVNQAIAEEILSIDLTTEQEMEMAKELSGKILRELGEIDADNKTKAIRKIASKLSYQGFNDGIIHEIIDRIIQR